MTAENVIRDPQVQRSPHRCLRYLVLIPLGDAHFNNKSQAVMQSSRICDLRDHCPETTQDRSLPSFTQPLIEGVRDKPSVAVVRVHAVEAVVLLVRGSRRAAEHTRDGARGACQSWHVRT
jgi:hypothetical protein